MVGLDTPWFMVKAPRLFQSFFAALGDLYLYKLSVILVGDCVAKWALFSQLTNWFMFYCITRTISNSLETVLTLVSLYYWSCMRPSSSKLPLESRKWGLIIAALACAIIWLYVGHLELFLTRNKLRFIFLEVAPMGVLVLGLTFLLDCLMYGSWVFVPFLRFNFLSAGGDYHKSHIWHPRGTNVAATSALNGSMDEKCNGDGDVRLFEYFHCISWHESRFGFAQWQTTKEEINNFDDTLVELARQMPLHDSHGEYNSNNITI